MFRCVAPKLKENCTAKLVGQNEHTHKNMFAMTVTLASLKGLVASEDTDPDRVNFRVDKKHPQEFNPLPHNQWEAKRKFPCTWCGEVAKPLVARKHCHFCGKAGCLPCVQNFVGNTRACLTCFKASTNYELRVTLGSTQQIIRGIKFAQHVEINQTFVFLVHRLSSLFQASLYDGDREIASANYMLSSLPELLKEQQHKHSKAAEEGTNEPDYLEMGLNPNDEAGDLKVYNLSHELSMGHFSSLQSLFLPSSCLTIYHYLTLGMRVKVAKATPADVLRYHNYQHELPEIFNLHGKLPRWMQVGEIAHRLGPKIEHEKAMLGFHKVSKVQHQNILQDIGSGVVGAGSTVASVSTNVLSKVVGLSTGLVEETLGTAADLVMDTGGAGLQLIYEGKVDEKNARTFNRMKR